MKYRYIEESIYKYLIKRNAPTSLIELTRYLQEKKVLIVPEDLANILNNNPQFNNTGNDEWTYTPGYERYVKSYDSEQSYSPPKTLVLKFPSSLQNKTKSESKLHNTQLSLTVVNRIKDILEKESQNTAISDQKISDILFLEGHKVSRRTVNKYRRKLFKFKAA